MSLKHTYTLKEYELDVAVTPQKDNPNEKTIQLIPHASDEKAQSCRSTTELTNQLKKHGVPHDAIGKVNDWINDIALTQRAMPAYFKAAKAAQQFNESLSEYIMEMEKSGEDEDVINRAEELSQSVSSFVYDIDDMKGFYEDLRSR